jgi:hypothetical protein
MPPLKVRFLLLSCYCNNGRFSRRGESGWRYCALILAVRTGNVEVIQALINAGSDPTASNFKAKDAIETAREKGNIQLWLKRLRKLRSDRRAKQSAPQ